MKITTICIYKNTLKLKFILTLLVSVFTTTVTAAVGMCTWFDAAGYRNSICTSSLTQCNRYLAYHQRSLSAWSSPAGCDGGWYVFRNAADRYHDHTLRGYIGGDFLESTANGTFGDLCRYEGLTCHMVIDWEGNYKGCEEPVRSDRLNDGSRVAYCARVAVPFPTREKDDL